nr:MAG TPA: hypothetical protein [Bacteriophage sp.]
MLSRSISVTVLVALSQTHPVPFLVRSPGI